MDVIPGFLWPIKQCLLLEASMPGYSLFADAVFRLLLTFQASDC
jgi:hypothetical protein